LFTGIVADFSAARVLGYSYNPKYIIVFFSMLILFSYVSDLSTYRPGSCPGVLLSGDNIKDSSFPREGMSLDWTGSFAFSRNPGEFGSDDVSDILAYKRVHVGEVLPGFFYTRDNNRDDDIESVVETISRLYISNSSRCIGDEIRAEADSCRCATPLDSHTIYGHPCDPVTKEFISDQCVFSRCEVSYQFFFFLIVHYV
jgi:hypothetical protein